MELGLGLSFRLRGANDLDYGTRIAATEKRFVVQADEILAGFLELESASL
jgi:hypothetical protein